MLVMHYTPYVTSSYNVMAENNVFNVSHIGMSFNVSNIQREDRDGREECVVCSDYTYLLHSETKYRLPTIVCTHYSWYIR